MRTHHISAGLALCVALLFSSIAAAQSVNLSWEANSESDLAGYRVYYGTSSRSYGPAIPVGNLTQYEVTGLDAGQTYYFAVTAVDTSGNESGYSQEDSATASAPPDTSSPTLAITTPTTAASYTATGNTITLGGNASDDTGVSSVSWQNASGGSGSASGTTSWSIADIALSEGSNVITVTAADAAGNQTSDTLTVSYTVPDTSAPTVSISYPTAASTYDTTSATLSLSGSASDDSGVSTISWQNSSGGSGSASGTTDWAIADIALSEGSNVITVTAADAAGNQASDTLSVVYTVPDANAPTVTITYPTDSTTYSTDSASLNVSGSASDDTGVSSVTWQNSRGGSGSAAGASSWSIANIVLSEGSNIITVTAQDTNGNQASDSVTVTYEPPDTANPQVTISSPTSSASYSTEYGTIDLAGAASDNKTLRRVTWQNASGGSGTASGTTSWSASGIGLNEGTNTITVTAEDTAGNQASDTLTVTYTIPVVAPPTPPPAPEPTIEPTTSASSEEQKGFTSILSQVLRAYRLKIKAQAAALAARLNRSQTSPVEDTDGPGVDSETSTYQNTETTERSYVTTSGTSEAISPVISIVSPTTEGEYDTGLPEIDLAGTTADSTEVLQVRWSTSNGDQGVAEGTASWEATGIPLVEGDNIITVTAVGVAENTYVHEMTVRYMP